jgi:hypothetical protein
MPTPEGFYYAEATLLPLVALSEIAETEPLDGSSRGSFLRGTASIARGGFEPPTFEL